MTGRRAGHSGRRRRSRPVAVVAWALVAGLVALGQVLDDPEAPPEAVAEVVAEAPPVVGAAPPEPEHEAVRVLASPPPAPASPAVAKRPTEKRLAAKRPFAAARSFATPLIMPRLRLPRAITPRLAAVSGLLSRAKPGEPIAVTLTAYCLRGRTRRGQPVRPGIIAADPRVFPMARHVELFAGGRYLGKFLVDDTGGHILGRRIDIWTPDCGDARAFGRRTGIATLVAR